MKRKLLKIGTLNEPRDRWMDVLHVFDEIHVACFSSEVEIQHPQIVYHKIQIERGINNFLFRAVIHSSRQKLLNWLTNVIIILFRITNRSLCREIGRIRFDEIHSSYNDFDESALLTLVLGCKNNFTRAQKETRLTYSYLEKKNFDNAKRIVLNDELNRDLFVSKYGDVFSGKKMIFHLDEDARRQDIKDIISYKTKFSARDGKIHAVILAGRVLSNPKEKRSGGRLYYLPLIREMVAAGIVVHLHTKSIEDDDGVNPYADLQEKSNDFHIEDKLDFLNDTLNAYSLLSRYDIGILHAHIPGEEVTMFDIVNLPHRYFEYELAHVLPIEKKGLNKLLEKKAECGYAKLIDSFYELTLENVKNDKWDTPGFKDYVDALYRKNDG